MKGTTNQLIKPAGLGFELPGVSPGVRIPINVGVGAKGFRGLVSLKSFCVIASFW